MEAIKPSLFFCVLAVSLFGCKNEKTQITTEEPLPNIVWLVAEDQSPDFFPMYGDSTIALPNLEALALDGVTFTNAVSPVPVCAPARSALITGMYPTTLGTHNMRTYNAYRDGKNEESIGIPSYSPLVPPGVKMFTEYLRKKATIPPMARRKIIILKKPMPPGMKAVVIAIGESVTKKNLFLRSSIFRSVMNHRFGPEVRIPFSSIRKKFLFRLIFPIPILFVMISPSIIAISNDWTIK